MIPLVYYPLSALFAAILITVLVYAINEARIRQWWRRVRGS